MESYKVLSKPAKGEITEKKSRFIASLCPVSTEEEALAFIEEKRKQYWDASHNCYAYVIGEESRTERCGDDGEPGQTAGRPMLSVLQGEGISNVCAVVTRYFGGTLLGTGGLIRAYSGAVAEALKQGEILLKEQGETWKVTVDYTGTGKIKYLAQQMGIRELDSEYTDRVCLTYLVKKDQTGEFLSQITETTSAKAKIEHLEDGMFLF